MAEQKKSERVDIQNPAPELVVGDDSIDVTGVPNFGPDYKIIKAIGQGGMGTVYHVRDLTIDQDLAIKVIRPELATDQAALKRFEQESRALSELNHPNIVAVFKSGKTATGAPYLVMNHIEGKSLASVIKDLGKLDVDRALKLFAQICDALHYAHDKGVIHRDLKPSNIILTAGGDETAHVVDFGIAKVASKSSETVTGLTQMGDVVGTPSYMSPEQCNGEKLDARSDIYSLGCMLYEVLKGEPPFVEASPFKLMTKHVSTKAPPLTDKHINSSLRDLVAKCLEKKPEKRYQSVDELLGDIAKIRKGEKIAGAKINLNSVLEPLRTPEPDLKKKRFNDTMYWVFAVVAAIVFAVFINPAELVPDFMPGEAVPITSPVAPIEVKVKPSVEWPLKEKARPTAKLPAQAPFSEPPLSESERTALREMLRNVMPENPRSVDPVLKLGRRAIPALLLELMGKDELIADRSALVLSRQGEDTAAPLIELFRTSANRNLENAILLLEDRGTIGLSTLLSDPDPQVRIRALKALGGAYGSRLLPTPVAERVLWLMKDDEVLVREQAAKSLWATPVKVVEDGYKWSALNDESEQVRSAALIGIMKIASQTDDHSKATMEIVAWCLQHDSDFIKKNAMQTGNTGVRTFFTKQFAPYLRAVYRLSNDEPRMYLMNNLFNLPEVAELLLPEIIDNLNSHASPSSGPLFVLGRMGARAKPALPALRQALRKLRTDPQRNEYQIRYVREAIEKISRS